MNKIDLHIHTNNSLDADFSVEEIINKAKAANLEIIAICDHDTVLGVDEAVKLGKKANIKVIKGIEISCVYKDVDLHILAYNINTNNPAYNKFLDDILVQERSAGKKRVQLIKDLGIYINMDKLNSLIVDDVIIGEAIGEASINEPENKDNPLIIPFLDNNELSDNPYVNFYWEFCAQNKPAYVEIKYPSLDEIVKIVNDDNGVLVFAHPGNNIKEDEKLLYEIMDKGLIGLEAYSSYHNDFQTKFYIEHALKNDWLITIGSDFHGKNKPKIKLANFDVDSEIQDKLIAKVLSF